MLYAVLILKFMSRPRVELLDYKHQALLDQLNDFCISLKIHLGYVDDERLKAKYPKPTVQEIDQMQGELNRVLKADAKPFIRR